MQLEEHGLSLLGAVSIQVYTILLTSSHLGHLLLEKTRGSNCYISWCVGTPAVDVSSWYQEVFLFPPYILQRRYFHLMIQCEHVIQPLPCPSTLSLDKDTTRCLNDEPIALQKLKNNQSKKLDHFLLLSKV